MHFPLFLAGRLFLLNSGYDISHFAFGHVMPHLLLATGISHLLLDMTFRYRISGVYASGIGYEEREREGEVAVIVAEDRLAA